MSVIPNSSLSRRQPVVDTKGAVRPLRPITNHFAQGASQLAQLRQPFRSATRTSRLLINATNPSAPTGIWWPRTPNYSAELHDLVSAAASHVGKTTRIAYKWNERSINHRAYMLPDDIDVVGPEDGQPSDIMNIHGESGVTLKIWVVPPNMPTTHPPA